MDLWQNVYVLHARMFSLKTGFLMKFNTVDERKSENVAEIVTKCFEAARENTGGPYEPERLLAYLTEPPAQTGRRVRDTFAGRRRFVRFMESLQIEFGICFTMKEWEQGFGLDEISRLIERKTTKPDSQARLALNREREARRMLWSEPIKFGILSMIPLGVVAGSGGVFVRTLCTLVWLCIVGVIWTIALRGYKYSKQLTVRAQKTVSPDDLPTPVDTV
mgnify:CR=1 FL=1